MTTEQENAHLRAGLELIASRAETIGRPNGTTKVVARIAVAALTGADIHAAAKPQRRKKS